MKVFSNVSQAETRPAVLSAEKGLNLRLVIFFTALTLVLTTVVIVTWEQILRPPYYEWVARNYPGSENAENRYKIEQRGEHFFISITVDVIVVSILLALVNRKQKRLIEAHHRLAQSERIAMLGRVAAQVAHEVRNPLSGMLLYSLHLKSKVNGHLAESEVELIDKIIGTINHLTNTTEQILNFARPVKLGLHWVDLNGVVADVLQLLQAEIQTQKIEVTMDLSDSRPAGMLDEGSIRAALLNLVLNAVQSMPDGGRLSISTDTNGKMLSVLISDTGGGISKEQLKHIFEPFNTTKSRGLGLGMPYAQRIVERHAGRISLDSQLGKGTRVRIELPRGEEQKR
ncbi:MAG: sensor histidine kinase [Pyrinomonadaceae bacterium]